MNSKRLFTIGLSALLLCGCADSLSLPVADDASQWDASWIGAPWEGDEYIEAEAAEAPLLKKTFHLDSKPSKAVVKVTGLGFFELYINGRRVGEDVLSPTETLYDKRVGLENEGVPMPSDSFKNYRVNYLTYDVTRHLRKGENTVEAVLGNGFYAISSPRWVAVPYGTPRFICRLDAALRDGSLQSVVSDSSWLAARSPILKNHMYWGEVYDARREGTQQWESVALRRAPQGILCPQPALCEDRVMERLAPVSIKALEDGAWEVDFGDYITGWPALKGIDAPEGTQIRIVFPVDDYPDNIKSEYRYICKGTGHESYAPRFVWYTFRKAVVYGWNGRLKPGNITAEAVYTNAPVNSEFACSEPLFNLINQIWLRTQQDNMHLGVPTDCPHREKGPYTGDGEVACVTVMHNLDADAFYRKWLRDISDCQNPVSGYVPNGAPWHPGCGGGVAWGAAMNIVPWEHYLHYGDISVLEEHFDAMCAQVGHMLSWCDADGIMCQKKPSREKPLYWMNLGEWCPSYGLAGEPLVHTWYLWRCASYTAKAAKALGRDEQAAYYAEVAERTALAFHKAFYNPETGSYGCASGTLDASGYGTGNGAEGNDGSNIFALAMGVPADRYESVIAAVKRELEMNDGHLNTGIFGTALFFEVLCENGMAQQAYEAMNKRDYPSYGWWIEQGADTFWEQWNGNDSRNHPMFGGGLVWLYRQLAGLQTDEQEPGYRHMIVKPHVVDGIDWARYSTCTSYGKASVEWKKASSGRVKMKVTVPQGCHATVYVPGRDSAAEVGAGTHRF